VVTDLRASGDNCGSWILPRSKPPGMVGVGRVEVEELEEVVAFVAVVVAEAPATNGLCL
jgi:hypothetical protein